MEYEGYELEAAEGTFELLVREALHPGMQFFDVDSYEVSHPRRRPGQLAHHRDRQRCAPRTACTPPPPPATVRSTRCTCACASVSRKLYPQITDVRLTDYKVRVLDSRKGTAAKVRVLIEWSDHRKSWSTVGVSDNVIEASWKALVDAIRLELMRLTEQDSSIEKAVEDYCWGV